MTVSLDIFMMIRLAVMPETMKYTAVMVTMIYTVAKDMINFTAILVMTGFTEV